MAYACHALGSIIDAKVYRIWIYPPQPGCEFTHHQDEKKNIFRRPKPSQRLKFYVAISCHGFPCILKPDRNPGGPTRLELLQPTRHRLPEAAKGHKDKCNEGQEEGTQKALHHVLRQKNGEYPGPEV